MSFYSTYDEDTPIERPTSKVEMVIDIVVALFEIIFMLVLTIFIFIPFLYLLFGFFFT